MAKLRFSRWLREHGWVVPGAYVVAALVAGAVLPQIDRHHTLGGIRLIETSAVDQDVGAIASGMLAFTAIVFSISLLVAQFWNMAYSFRLMQWLRKVSRTGHGFVLF